MNLTISLAVSSWYKHSVFHSTPFVGGTGGNEFMLELFSKEVLETTILQPCKLQMRSVTIFWKVGRIGTCDFWWSAWSDIVLNSWWAHEGDIWFRLKNRHIAFFRAWNGLYPGRSKESASSCVRMALCLAIHLSNFCMNPKCFWSLTGWCLRLIRQRRRLHWLKMHSACFCTLWMPTGADRSDLSLPSS